MPRPAREIVLRPERCTGCRLCELACVEHHYGPVPGHDISHPWVFERRRLAIRGAAGDWRLEVCDHCEAHPCVGACPHLALLLWPGGPVSLVEPRCTGCGACVAVCDRHAIRRVGALDKAIKCDGCGPGPEPPPCARACPEGALEVGALPRLTAPPPAP